MDKILLQLKKRGYKYIAGIDEVGRGCLAGPVVAGAVILPLKRLKFFRDIKDSKKLTPIKREKILKRIKEVAVDYAVGICSPLEIEKLNILQASLLAMKRAAKGLKNKPDYLLIDGNKKIGFSKFEKAVIKGDEKCVSISAASILAKVYRDLLMKEWHKKYPAYNFKKNKGYPTREHVQAIEKKGICGLHRRTFKHCSST